MNINFKTNLVALLAIVSGTAFGSTCYGVQRTASEEMPVGTGVVLPVERSHAGAFGAVVPATDSSAYYRPQNLPPIVSSSEATNSVPPIVTPNRTLREEVNLAQKLPAPKYRPQKSSMLAPIAAEEPVVAEVASIDPNMAPPTIIQASNAVSDASDKSKVTKAAQWGPGGYVSNATSSAGVQLYPGESAGSVLSSRSASAPPIISASSKLVSPSMPPVTTPPQAVDPSYDPNFGQPQSGYSPQYLSVPPTEGPVISSPVCNSCGGGCTDGCGSPVTSMIAPAIPDCGACAGGGCSDCGVATAVGGAVTSNCNSCGNNGCYNASSVASRAGTSGLVSASRRYLFAEGLYFTRRDGTISNSNFGSLNNFDWNGGLRVTYGAKNDSLRGRELTYMGLLPIEESVTRTDSGGRISARFGGFDGFTGAETSAFRNAVEQSELKETELHTLEYNAVTYGWDVIKSFAGLRYIYVDDLYQINSVNTLGEIGNFEMSTVNNLIGPHIGGEIFYDVGYRLSYSLMTKAGAYINFNKIDTRLTNDGSNFINGEDTNVGFSTSLEASILAHYQLSQTARLRVGYNVLWLGEVASVADNFNPLLSPTAASQTNDSDDMLFHGLSFGLEVFR